MNRFLFVNLLTINPPKHSLRRLRIVGNRRKVSERRIRYKEASLLPNFLREKNACPSETAPPRCGWNPLRGGKVKEDEIMKIEQAKQIFSASEKNLTEYQTD